MDTKILITGASGTVGKEVVNQLVAKKISVRAGIHSASKLEKFKGPEIEPIEFDFERVNTIEKALIGIEKVFLITPMVEKQVDLATRFIDIARNSGVRHIVKLSVAGADEEPGITLFRWHRIVERYISGSGLTFTMLRPRSFMQNFKNFFHPVNGKINLPLGDGKVSYIDVRDIASIAVKVLTEDGYRNKSYTLTGGEALSLYEVADIISRESGKKVTYINIPEENARQEMKNVYMPEWLINAMMEIHYVCKLGKAEELTNVVEKIIERKPIIFSKFVKDHINIFK